MIKHDLVGLWMAVVLALGVGACSPEESNGDGEVPKDTHEAETHELQLHADEVQAWGIRPGRIETTTISAELTLPGAITLNENRTARVAPLVAGQISQLFVDLGSRVGTGQILVTMNSPQFTQAQTQFLQAFAQAELSRKDFERAQVLREQQAIEEREFLRRQALYEQHLAERRSAEGFLQSLGVDEDRMRELEQAVNVSNSLRDDAALDPQLAIRTPTGGVVIERNAILGEHVEPGQVLFTVSDLSSLWAQLDAYEEQMAYLSHKAEVVIRSTLFPDRDFPGRVSVISDQVDEELRTVRVRADVPNPAGLLKPNMYVQGFLRLHAEDEERMVVPVDAVQLLEGQHVVFVFMPEEPGEDHIVIRGVDVVPGETLSVGRIIESGLDGSEVIVAVGAFELKAELTKGAGGHGHVH